MGEITGGQPMDLAQCPKSLVVHQCVCHWIKTNRPSTFTKENKGSPRIVNPASGVGNGSFLWAGGDRAESLPGSPLTVD